MRSPGTILCMRPANERRRYNVTSSLIERAHTQNDPWISGDISVAKHNSPKPDRQTDDSHIVVFPINISSDRSIMLNSLGPRQNRRHFAEDVFKCNFMNENV